tara:strand:- start:481 stop:723 length:243 start_codon:yes stop_codon:yes gene_type:complete
MTLQQLTELFGWISIINIAILLFSTLALIGMRDFITRIHARLFGLETNDLTRAYFQYLAQFKIITVTLVIAPYLAMKIIS